MKELAKISSWKYSKFLSNKRYNFSRKQVLKHLSKQFIDKAYKKISKWKGYSPTPLIKLDKLNKNLKLKNIFYKDESKRFHLKSFKALGGAYAVEVLATLCNLKIKPPSSSYFTSIPLTYFAISRAPITEIGKAECAERFNT